MKIPQGDTLKVCGPAARLAVSERSGIDQLLRNESREMIRGILCYLGVASTSSSPSTRVAMRKASTPAGTPQ